MINIDRTKSWRKMLILIMKIDMCKRVLKQLLQYVDFVLGTNRCFKVSLPTQDVTVKYVSSITGTLCLSTRSLSVFLATASPRSTIVARRISSSKIWIQFQASEISTTASSPSLNRIIAMLIRLMGKGAEHQKAETTVCHSHPLMRRKRVCSSKRKTLAPFGLTMYLQDVAECDLSTQMRRWRR